MMLVLANQGTAARRRMYFHLVDATDGMTPETGEAGGQPQISSDGGAWTNTGIGTLNSIGNGDYYADVTLAAVSVAGTSIKGRYKSANTAECPAVEMVRVVAFDVDDAAALGLSRLDVATGTRATQTSVDILATAAAAIKAKTDQLVFSLAGKVDAAIVDAASFAQAAADKAWVTAARTLTAFGFAVDISAAAVAAVWGAATRTLTAFGFAVDLSAAGVAAVWSATTRTLTAGVDITVASVAAVWDYLTSALVTPGSVGQLVVSTLDVSVSSRASQASVDAIEDAVGALGDPLMAIVPGGYPSGSAGAALGRIGTGVVQYVSPLSQDGTRMDVKRGDDYLSADARAFVWTDGENMWLDPLASATFTARIGGVITLTKPCDVTVPTGAGKQVRLELTAEETAALELGTPAYRFDVELVDADGHKDSAQIHGRMYVVEDQTHA